MSRTRLLTIAVVLSFVAASSLAHAGPRNTDASFWPAPKASSSAAIDAYAQVPNGRKVAPKATNPLGPHYSGGPKGISTFHPK